MLSLVFRGYLVSCSHDQCLCLETNILIEISHFPVAPDPCSRCIYARPWKQPEDEKDSDDEELKDPRSFIRQPPPPQCFLETPADIMEAKKRALRLEMLMKMIDEYHAKHGRHADITYPASGNAGATPCNDEDTAHQCERTGEGLRGTGVGQVGGQTDGPRQPSRHQTVEPTGSYNPKMQVDNRVESKIDPMNISLPVIGTRESPPFFVSNKPTVDTAAATSAQKSLEKKDRPSHQTMPIIGALLKNPPVHNEITTLHGDKCMSTVIPVSVVCICCGGEGGKGHGRLCEHTFRRCGLCRVQEVERVLYQVGGRRRRRRDGEEVRDETKPVRIYVVFWWVND